MPQEQGKCLLNWQKRPELNAQNCVLTWLQGLPKHFASRLSKVPEWRLAGGEVGAPQPTVAEAFPGVLMLVPGAKLENRNQVGKGLFPRLPQGTHPLPGSPSTVHTPFGEPIQRHPDCWLTI